MLKLGSITPLEVFVITQSISLRLVFVLAISPFAALSASSWKVSDQ